MALKDLDRPYFIVGGEVGKPGKYELRSDTTVAEAVQIARGLTPDAKHSQVVLFRWVNDDLVETRLLNLKKMLKESSLKEDAPPARGPGVRSTECDLEDRPLPDQTLRQHVHELHRLLEKRPPTRMADEDPIRRGIQAPPPTLRKAMVLFRQRRVFVCVSGLVLAAAILYLIAGERYEANMKLLVRRGRADAPASAQQNAPIDLTRMEITEEELNSEVELLRDDEVLRKVVEQTGLGGRDWLHFLRRGEGNAECVERDEPDNGSKDGDDPRPFLLQSIARRSPVAGKSVSPYWAAWASRSEAGTSSHPGRLQNESNDFRRFGTLRESAHARMERG